MRARSPEPAADAAVCRALLRGGSRSFYAASWLLPPRFRRPATALYAFCRIADDAVDLGGAAPEALARLRERLDRVYAGRPLPIAADRAFAEVVARCALPRALPQALIEGFEWDAEGRRYADLAALEAYAARVAGTVGAMMAVVLGARGAPALARATDLGVAMQLTNIARDVGEDARAGRLYLPLDWLREAGIDADAWLARPAFSPALGAVVARLLRHADALYRRAAGGIGYLPPAARPAMHAARLLYAGIGREVERRGFDSVNGRAVVPAPRKALLLLAALAASMRPAARAQPPAAAAARFLVEAAALPNPPRPAPWWHLPARIARMVELFERLERRQAGAYGARPLRAASRG
jgi:phytoene synthase